MLPTTSVSVAEDKDDASLSPPRSRRSSLVDIALLALLAVIAVLVQGYHFGSDDSATYIPAIEQCLHPQLFPYGSAIFRGQAHWSLFAPLLAVCIHLSHMPLQWALLLLQVLGTWLLLAAALSIARRCFARPQAQWAAVVTLACLLPVPVAGTSLSIMDAYITARTLSTPLILLSIAALLAKHRGWAACLLCAAALIHPLMAAVGLLFFLALEWLPWLERSTAAQTLAAIAIPFGRAPEPYRRTLIMRDFLYPAGWQWFEWMGVIVPLAVLACLVFWRPRNTLPAVRNIAAASAAAGILATAVFLFLGLGFEQLYRLQPMRVFQVVTTLFFLLLGGLAGEYLLQKRPWRWLCLFVPICLLFFALDRVQYPLSRHTDWPGASPRNPWAQAFDWVRMNTPENAVFALPPRYIVLAGEEKHGFRAIAERSMLADWAKDSGPVSVIPQLASVWWHDQQLTVGWDAYKAADFNALATRSPVTWVIVQPRQAAGLNCPYHNAAVYACRLKPPAGSR